MGLMIVFYLHLKTIHAPRLTEIISQPKKVEFTKLKVLQG
jgi:hypothetical protein